MEKTETASSTSNLYSNYAPGSEELIKILVEEHVGWATSIARAVARAWNMDWQLDGLDGGAYEGLLFCARRYDPSRGVPFKAYARRRIHESTTEEARKSKTWQRGVGSDTEQEQEAREISLSLFHLYPELREGLLPIDLGGDEDSTRNSIRQLLASASMLITAHAASKNNPESALQHKQMVEILSTLESVHQNIIWAIYWQGQSMRNLAQEWKIDELAIVREHQEIIHFVSETFSNPRSRLLKKLKIRPGLRVVAHQLRKSKQLPPFSKFVTGKAGKAELKGDK